MFTGIIQALGKVVFLDGGRLRIATDGAPWEDPVAVGESVAVNGCCLTVASLEEGVHFDLSEETLKRTALGDLRGGVLVNLERSLRPLDRIGGHIVQGHVDGVGSCLNITQAEGSWVFRFGAPDGCDRYLVDKCSVAVDGISLTVVRPTAGAFDAWIVPHTFENTNLRDMKRDQPVNMEFDLLFKYVERLVSAR